MQKWKMIKREVKCIFGEDIKTFYNRGSHILSFGLDRLNLNKDSLSKLASSSTIKDIYIIPRCTRINGGEYAWMECFTSGEKEDKWETKEAPQ